MARVTATAGFTVFPPPASTRQRKARGATDTNNSTDTSPKRREKSWKKPTHSQDSSPLLAKLAPEIRVLIYSYALLIDDTPNLFQLDIPTTVNDRPNLPAPETVFRPSLETKTGEPKARKRRLPSHKHQFALLKTCQQIYNEAHLLRVKVNTHVLRYPPVRVLSYPLSTHAREYLARVPKHYIRHIQYLHIFAGANRFRTSYDPETQKSGYRSESLFAELCVLRCGGGFVTRNANAVTPTRLPRLDPVEMTITVRDHDWVRSPVCQAKDTIPKFADSFLRCRDWESVFGGLRRLTIELEVRADWTDLLETEVRKVAAYEFDIGEGKKLMVRMRVLDNSDESNDPRYSKRHRKRQLFDWESTMIKKNHILLERTDGDSSDATADMLEESLVTNDQGQQVVPIVLFTIEWEAMVVKPIVTVATEDEW